MLLMLTFDDLCLLQWLSPFLSEQSDAGVHSYGEEISYFRSLARGTPEIIDFILEGTFSFSQVLFRILCISSSNHDLAYPVEIRRLKMPSLFRTSAAGASMHLLTVDTLSHAGHGRELGPLCGDMHAHSPLPDSPNSTQLYVPE